MIKKEAPKAFKEVVLMDKFGYVRAVSDTVYEKNKELQALRVNGSSR